MTPSPSGAGLVRLRRRWATRIASVASLLLALAYAAGPSATPVPLVLLDEAQAADARARRRPPSGMRRPRVPFVRAATCSRRPPSCRARPGAPRSTRWRSSKPAVRCRPGANRGDPLPFPPRCRASFATTRPRLRSPFRAPSRGRRPTRRGHASLGTSSLSPTRYPPSLRSRTFVSIFIHRNETRVLGLGLEVTDLLYRDQAHVGAGRDIDPPKVIPFLRRHIRHLLQQGAQGPVAWRSIAP